MGFARTVLWISVIALAVQGLTRNGQRLQRLYEDSRMLARAQRAPSGDNAETRVLSVGLATMDSIPPVYCGSQNPDEPAAPPDSEEAAIVEEIIDLRKQMGRPSVADAFSAVRLPGDQESGSVDEIAREKEQEELFRQALRQMPGEERRQGHQSRK